MQLVHTPLERSKIEEAEQIWHADFVMVHRVLLFELVSAATFMDITCFAVAIFIKGKPVEEIRNIFHIQNGTGKLMV